MAKDNNSRGIVLIIIAMTLFAMQDSLIKYIFEKAALYEIFFGRYFVAAVLLFLYVKFKKEKVSLKTYYPFLTLFRVLLHFLAFSAFFISLTYMPLATANALFFSCPFFVSIFAKIFLKDLSNRILLAKKQNDYNKIIAIDNDRRIIIDQIFSKGIKTLSEADINIIKIIAEENENLISEISVATTKSIEKANIKIKAIKGYNL